MSKNIVNIDRVDKNRVNKNRVNSIYGDNKKNLPTFSTSQKPIRAEYLSLKLKKL